MAIYIDTELVKWERMRKRQDGDDKTPFMLIQRSIDLHAELYFFNTNVMGKYEDAYEKYSLLLKVKIMYPFHLPSM